MLPGLAEVRYGVVLLLVYEPPVPLAEPGFGLGGNLPAL
jgi:hypothetical protein